jgi:GNAT superfamily N-acetyltransferase
MNDLDYRAMRRDEAETVSRFIGDVFDRFVAPHYNEQGVANFLKYVEPQALVGLLEAGHIALVAVDRASGSIVGMIDVMEAKHISLLFVDAEYQRRGVAKKLLDRAIEACSEKRPDLEEITVNSSPNAVPAYRRLGFLERGAEEERDGIRHTPMVLRLPPNR